jgi:geranylgeranyl diphosphate synthase type II
MADLNKAILILEKYKKPVWREIQKYLYDDSYPTAFTIPVKYQKDVEFYWKSVRDYPKRQGKYLRPTLLLLAAKAMGADVKKAVKTAAAMQLSEEWLLIHDDIQDRSLARRGKPALQRLYGDELALNAGDTLHVIMWKIITDNEVVLDKKKALAVANEFYQVLKRTADGQAVEIMWTKDGKVRTNDEDWFFIADGKTAYYTIAAPLRLGAIIAGVNQKQLDALAEFGVSLGRCFQLVDDILDLTSDFKGSGKKPGSDIYEGKKTLLISHLVRSARKEDKKKILAILRKPPEKKTEKDVSWILQKMAEYKSIDYAMRVATKLKEMAYKMFEKNLVFLSEKAARKELKTLLDFVLERKH